MKINDLLHVPFLLEADKGAGSGGAAQGATGQPAADPGSPPATDAQGAPAQDGTGDDQPTLVDVTATDEQGRKLWYSWEDHVKVHQEAASWRTKYQDLVKQQESGTPAADPATEPAASTVDTSQFEQQITTLSSENQQLKIANAVIAEAAKVTAERGAFHDPALAVKLADLSGVTIGEDGTVSGVAEAVAQLAEQHSYLLQTSRPPATNRAANPARTEALTREQIEAMTPQDYLKRKKEVDDFLRTEHMR